MQTYSVEANQTAMIPMERSLGPLDGTWDSIDDHLNQVIAGRTTEEIAEAIVAVPEKERVVLAFYFFEELTLEEIGSIFALRRHAVSEILISALSHLQAILGGQPA